MLAAAARALIAQGPNVSLDAVAKEAGVSKGGLLHHFRSKQALIVGLIEEWFDHYDATVESLLEPEDVPGRWTRAHIRATFAPHDDLWSHPSVVTALLGVPELQQRLDVAADRWRRQTDSDGLHPHRADIISRALDGVTLADLLWRGQETGEKREHTRDLLLKLTEQTGPLV
ncbi:TetR/AcrR family transcriptional regulator [Lentzea sp. CC55]|uniref:TetR/AcrR family transcriptional regulator n=1 Tax=Lentzea sp. CC55 TaxID=2884909 RepID=UPI0027DED66D|nr:TetR/AcrR family transcriptional regulator [Lentzea sp. CC55]MCG8926014.1 TetR/AcrR family transcriptional regulator [Lentzea sp. CC55]